MVVNDLRKNQKLKLSEHVLAGATILGIADLPITVTILDMPELSTSKYQFIAMIDMAFTDTYRLYIAKFQPTNEVKLAVAHELIHLKQFVDGRLTISSDRTIGLFDGEPILPPYSPSQPHEVEAFKEMIPLIKKIKKYLKQNK